MDDLDRAIRHKHHQVLTAKAELEISRHLARRDVLSPDELELTVAFVRFQEAREAERIACLALLAAGRDLRGWAIPRDGVKELALRLEWLKRGVDMVKVIADLQTYLHLHDRELYRRNVLSYPAWIMSCFNHNMARAELAGFRVSQARATSTLTALTGLEAVDPEELLRLDTAVLRANVRYLEITAARDEFRYARAKELLHRGLVSWIEFLGWKKAYDRSRDQLAVERKQLTQLEAQGERHPKFIRNLIDLASILQSRGDLERAGSLYERVLTLCRAIPADHLTKYAKSLDGLANVSVARGDIAGAEPLFRQTMEITKQVLGEGHPVYAESLSQMANLYRIMGDFAQAKALHAAGPGNHEAGLRGQSSALCQVPG